MLDWLQDLLYNKSSGGPVNVGNMDWLGGQLQKSVMPFNQGNFGTPKPPPVTNNGMYDEGSRLRESRDQAARLNQQGDMPSMSEIMSRLQSLSDPSRYGMSPDELMNQARAGASAQYDPIISQLRGAQSQAQQRGERNRDQLGQMFGQLSASLNADIAPLEQKGAQTRQNVGNQFDQLKQSIGQTYDTSQRQQEDMMQRLNIEAAAPEVLGKQETDQAYFTNRANVDQNTATTALDQENRGNVEYTRRGAEVAQVEGAQRQGDLMSRLQEVMDAYQNQIGANEAAKGSAIQKMFGELSGQANEQAYKLADRDYDQYLQSIQLGRQLSNDAFSRQGKGSVTQTQSLADVGGRAMSLGLPSGSAQRLQDIFSSTLSGDDRIKGGINPDTGSALNDYQMAQYVLDAGREQGLTQAELNALQAIALEYFK